MMRRLNQLERTLDEGEFCFTAELVPPLSTDTDKVLVAANSIKEKVHAINVTDSAGAKTTLSALVAASVLALNDIEPVLQLTCRDRNRIALSAELLGASAYGICNLLPLTGDTPANGDQPDAKAVNDINTVALIELARGMCEDRALPGGRKIDPPPYFFIGAADVPRRINRDKGHPGLIRKIDAGARFVQTQLCYDIDLIAAYMDGLAQWDLIGSVKVLIGLGPVASARSAKWMKENLWGVAIPDPVLQRLADSADPMGESRRVCIELIEKMQQIDGVAGVHLMAPGQSIQSIAELLSELSG